MDTCIDSDAGPCKGVVRDYTSRSGCTVSARCDAHHDANEQRLDQLDARLQQDYPGWDNPHSSPPQWFDPGVRRRGMVMLFGYARVSTADQNLDHQADALRRAGVDEANVHTDIASGAKASRPEWDILLGKMREGDMLKTTRLDRIGRSLQHLVNLGADLRERGIGLHVIEQGIDTSTSEGRMMFGMLAVLAEFQRELIVANTRDGLAAARARGRVGGRKRTLTPAQAAHAQELYDARDLTVQQIADLLRVPRSTVYGYLAWQKRGDRPHHEPDGANT